MLLAEAPGKLRAEALMKQVRHQLEELAPDIIIEVASDHFTNFFYNNLPQFCVGAMAEAEGPAETYCAMPRPSGSPPSAEGLHGVQVRQVAAPVDQGSSRVEIRDRA
jgi:hypothetical protein